MSFILTHSIGKPQLKGITLLKELKPEEEIHLFRIYFTITITVQLDGNLTIVKLKITNYLRDRKAFTEFKCKQFQNSSDQFQKIKKYH